MPALTFTLDLEDHRPRAEAEVRWPRVTRELLDFLAERDIRATVFVVGELALTHREVVAEVAGAGHEIALHSWDHRPLTVLDRDEFVATTRRGKAILEDLVGRSIVGYRAPTFSLVPSTAWATEELALLGFRYSSSVLPARNPLFGWPGAPRDIFRWPSGLLELPSPVLGARSLAIPFVGGTYLRALPIRLVEVARRRLRVPAVPWSYCHPYDLDADEPFWVVPGNGQLGSRLLWYNRRRMRHRLDRLFAFGAAAPLGERVDALGVPPPTFFHEEARR